MASETAMQRAFANAKVIGKPIDPSGVTRREVVWRVVKESMPNGIVLFNLKKRLHMISGQTISAALNDMEGRSMVYAKDVPNTNPGVHRTVKRYFTDMERYEALPPPPKPKKKPGRKPKSRDAGNVAETTTRASRTSQASGTAPANATRLMPVLAPESDIDAWLETLTLAQARALHAKLESIFHAKK